MEFAAGLFLGAILGVVADRIWEMWEKRPRVSIRAGIYVSYIGEGSGLRLSISNVGKKELPEYEVLLFHPQRGTLSAFPTTACGTLLPGQQREHRCPLLDRDSNRPFLRNWFFHERDNPVTDPVVDEFQLRLQMKNSKVVLFESREVGVALAKYWVKALQRGDPVCGNGEDLVAISYPKRSRLQRWLNARRLMRKSDG